MIALKVLNTTWDDGAHFATPFDMEQSKGGIFACSCDFKKCCKKHKKGKRCKKCPDR